jgi:dipeptidyl aminopeptidase/acylaminoacyl peptidase
VLTVADVARPADLYAAGPDLEGPRRLARSNPQLEPQRYVQHSAVMFADRITTPLLLLTGEQDQNVPAGNTREMFYALRRLGKEVEWVNYMNGGHGAGNASESDYRDFVGRIVGWYDAHLKTAAPKKTASMDEQ